jgi:hypothetical protein
MVFDRSNTDIAGLNTARLKMLMSASLYVVLSFVGRGLEGSFAVVIVLLYKGIGNPGHVPTLKVNPTIPALVFRRLSSLYVYNNVS